MGYIPKPVNADDRPCPMLSICPDNTLGTENVIRCVNGTGGVAFFINTSTQYVVTPEFFPPIHAI